MRFTVVSLLFAAAAQGSVLAPRNMFGNPLDPRSTSCSVLPTGVCSNGCHDCQREAVAKGFWNTCCVENSVSCADVSRDPGRYSGAPCRAASGGGGGGTLPGKPLPKPGKF